MRAIRECDLPDDFEERYESVWVTPPNAELCDPMGLRPMPKLLRGWHKGRSYPEGYTPAEREAFRRANLWAREAYGELAASRSEAPTIWPMEDDEWLDRRRDFRGLECEAGRKMVAIHPDGAVFRCGSHTPLGNILRGTFAQTEGPARCETSFCLYYCRKYTAQTAA